MRSYYFTFGNDSSQPFYGGWIIVKAKNMECAEEIFKLYFPCAKNDETVNCAFVYSEWEFKKTKMYSSDNFGKRCHGIIGFKALKNK